MMAVGLVGAAIGCGPDSFRFVSVSSPLPTASAPVFTPPAGTYSVAQSVTLTDATAGAAIYYTTNGTTPTVASTLYSGPITVSATETIEAVAVAAGYQNSAVATAVYAIAASLPTASVPVFTPPGGTYSVAQSVTLTDTTAGAAIYYTTNGSTPTTASTLYSGPITVSSTETIEALAVAAGYQNSIVVTETYTIVVPLPTASTPVFTPPAGTYSVAQSVTLTDATAGAAIYYTTNGSTPSVGSSLYTGAIMVSASETIEAIAVAAGYNNSAVASASYTIGTTTPTTGQWTWMAGSSTAGGAGIYGTKGVAAAGNTPSGRSGAVRWTDSNGNFWLFGGTGIGSNSYFNGYNNDLWEFKPSTNQWTWVSGSNTPNDVGVYGTLGVSAPGNVPPARAGAAGWMDSSGNFWIFGGFTQTTAAVDLDDLWMFNPGTNQWTWMGGTTTYGKAGTYGTQGVASPSNMPSARSDTASCTDAQGNFWMFGGFNQAPGFGQDGYLNDMWEFSPSTNEWTWWSGSQTYNQPGIYGTLGVAAAANTPGARIDHTCTTDLNGNIWVFGGLGLDSSSSLNGELQLNDLWEFNTTTKQWAWMSGSSTRNAYGVYGTQGLAAAGNVPGSREIGSSWTDSHGDLWIFGGAALDPSFGTPILINDLWRYQIATNEWTWMGGGTSFDAPGNYGTLGVSAPSNIPGARDGTDTWTDSSGNLWLFGGYGTASINNSGGLNDMWRYQP